MRSARPLAFLLLCLVAATPGLGASPASKAGGSPDANKAAYHVLQAGETLYSIARKYDVSADAIMAANGISDPAKVKAGQKLLIPSLHTVRKGETLYGIAKSYGLSLEELRSANKLKADATIRVGDRLLVPGKKVEGSAPPPAAPPAAAPSGATSGVAANGAGAAPGANPSPTNPGPALSPVPPLPAIVKTQSKPVDAKVTWPCEGQPAYLDGKAQGVIIRSRLGEPQKAVASGKVVAAGPFRGYGEMVIVMSRTGYLYVYAGNQSLTVGIGDAVRSGQELGRVGVDSKEGAPIAFFMVYRGREVIDPAEAPRD